MKYIRPYKTFICCGKVLAVDDSLKGRKIICPYCGKLQRVTQTEPQVVYMAK